MRIVQNHHKKTLAVVCASALGLSMAVMAVFTLFTACPTPTGGGGNEVKREKSLKLLTETVEVSTRGGKATVEFESANIKAGSHAAALVEEGDGDGLLPALTSSTSAIVGVNGKGALQIEVGASDFPAAYSFHLVIEQVKSNSARLVVTLPANAETTTKPAVVSAQFNRNGAPDPNTASFTLTGAAIEARTRWFVYSDEGVTAAEGVTLTVSGGAILLASKTTLPAIDYWVSAQAPGKKPSGLLKLSVVDYDPVTDTVPPQFAASAAYLAPGLKSVSVGVLNAASYTGTLVWTAYTTTSGTVTLPLTASLAAGSLTLSSTVEFTSLPAVTLPLTLYVSVTEDAKRESSRTPLTVTLPQAPTPVFVSGVFVLDKGNTAEFTLVTPTAISYDTWAVYSGESGQAKPAGVTVGAVGFTVTLTGTPALAADTYFVSACNADTSESERVELRVVKKAFTASAGTGKLVSLGAASAPGAKTYYIDAENGDDGNDGLSPLHPWRSFKNPNSTTFGPGDHILLEADSIWNGESVTPANYTTLLDSDTVGMLWPKGSGSAANPIVIDLYDAENFDSALVTVYYSADHRPVINGNGTPSVDNSSIAAAYNPSGAVQLYDQSFWEIRNLEVTNTFADFTPGAADTKTLADGKDYGSGPLHWQKLMVPKGLAGIFFTGYQYNTAIGGGGEAVKQPNQRHITVQNCYVHDVQSESTNNKSGIANHWRSDYFGARGSADASKTVGGIIADGSVADILIEDNIVRKCGLEGARTGGGIKDNVVFRGNWIEYIMGDGLVLAAVDFSGNWTGGVKNDLRADVPGGLVEHNIIKEAASGPMSDVSGQSSSNYASCWAYMAHNSLFQYNEAFGTLYGCLDGEAWDVDSFSDRVIYQYNYSHHNSGGCCLFMYDQTNSVFRYNLSANDGGGSVYMASIEEDHSDSEALSVDKNTVSYIAWPDGQSIFHYTVGASSGSPTVPLIYNNTFFVGDGLHPALYGNTSTGSPDKYVRFYNNIIVKEDDLATGADGAIVLSNKHDASAKASGKIVNTAGFKNNILWAYEKGRPATGLSLTSYFSNGTGAGIGTFVGAGLDNAYEDPGLVIEQGGAGEAALRSQRGTKLRDYNDPAALHALTGVSALRARASLLTSAASSPVFGAGLPITTTGAAASAVVNCDGAWNRLDESWYTSCAEADRDLFGAAIDFNAPPIGAAAAAY